MGDIANLVICVALVKAFAVSAEGELVLAQMDDRTRPRGASWPRTKRGKRNSAARDTGTGQGCGE